MAAAARVLASIEGTPIAVSASMRRVHAVLVSFLTAGCSSSLALPPGGTGGFPATGGVPGTGGVPATGGVPGTGGVPATGGIPGTGGLGATGGAPDGGAGADGGLPMCPPGAGPALDGDAGTPLDLESCIYDAANSFLVTSVSAPVTVVSVDQVAAGNCGSFSFFASTTAPGVSAKVVFQTADQQQHWTAYLRLPGLPADTIQPGDAFDLSVSAQSVFWQGTEQMITLAKNGQLVLFGYSGFEAASPAVSGVTVRRAGATCASGSLHHDAVNVTNGATSAVVAEGETKQVGNLSFTLSHAFFCGCDTSDKVIFGGFTTAP